MAFIETGFLRELLVVDSVSRLCAFYVLCTAHQEHYRYVCNLPEDHFALMPLHCVDARFPSQVIWEDSPEVGMKSHSPVDTGK